MQRYNNIIQETKIIFYYNNTRLYSCSKIIKLEPVWTSGHDYNNYMRVTVAVGIRMQYNNMYTYIYYYKLLMNVYNNYYLHMHIKITCLNYIH